MGFNYNSTCFKMVLSTYYFILESKKKLKKDSMFFRNCTTILIFISHPQVRVFDTTSLHTYKILKCTNMNKTLLKIVKFFL